MSEPVKIAATVVFVLVWSVLLWLYTHPRSNVPGLSRLICTVSGGAWDKADGVCYSSVKGKP